MIRLDPSLLEDGLRLVDFGFRAGRDLTLDAVGIDRSGRPALVVIAEAEAGLPRLLDGCLWASDQRDLLQRLYAGSGLREGTEPRGFLLAPSFSHAFLRRLSLLSVEVVTFLAREVSLGDGTRRSVVEPAAVLFGLAEARRASPASDEDVPPVPAVEPEVEPREDRRPFWPEGILPDETDRSRGSLPVVTMADGSPDPEPAIPELRDAETDDMPWPEPPDDRFPWEIDPARLEQRAPVALAEDPPAATPPSQSFETLTAEELLEFERFDRQRRERGRRSPS